MTMMVDVKRAVERGAIEAFDTRILEDVRVESGTDIDGEEILRVTLILPEGAIDALGGERLLNGSVHIKDAVRAIGETRRPILYYATAAELEEDGDSES